MRNRLSRVALLLAFLVVAAMQMPSQAQVQQSGVAILVVTDSSDTAMRAREKAVTDFVKKLRSEYGLDKSRLPILSYHFENPVERQYCEEKLGIHRSDLVFIGVVQQDHLVVKTVLKRAPRVQDPDSAAFQMFQRVALKLGIDIKPAGLPEGSPTVAPGSTIAYKRFAISNETGEEQYVFKNTDKALFFYVFADNLDEQHDRDHDVEVHIESSDRSVKPGLIPVIGGHFTLHAGVPWKNRDLLELAAADGSGLAIAPTAPGIMTLSQYPLSDYLVTVDLDGQKVAESHFSIVGPDYAKVADGKLAIDEAFISDEKGHPTTTFTPGETPPIGVFCFVTMSNLAPDEEHSHTIGVTYLDPNGKPYQRTLGGSFTVHKGQDLRTMEFPDDVDPSQSNGFVMKNGLDHGPFGQWTVQVTLDGQMVKELHFTLNPPAGGATTTDQTPPTVQPPTDQPSPGAQ